MKLTKYVILSLLAVASLVMAQSVSAAEASQEQELEQQVEVDCTAGAYGQESTCEVDAYQKGTQKQTITLNDGTVIKSHEPVNAGLDMSTGIAVASLTATGVTAIITRRKLV